jgi:hypothetical protein
MNGPFANAQAERFARRALRTAGDDPRQQVAWVLYAVTQRRPTDEEIELGQAFLDDVMTTEGLSDAEALRFFCLLQLNSNEFMYLD